MQKSIQSQATNSFVENIKLPNSYRYIKKLLWLHSDQYARNGQIM